MQKQLMESLRKKLGVLREAQRGLQDDIRANAQLGEEVGRDFILSFIHLSIVSLTGFYSCYCTWLWELKRSVAHFFVYFRASTRV